MKNKLSLKYTIDSKEFIWNKTCNGTTYLKVDINETAWHKPFDTLYELLHEAYGKNKSIHGKG